MNLNIKVLKPDDSHDLQFPLIEKMDKFVIKDHSLVRN